MRIAYLPFIVLAWWSCSKKESTKEKEVKKWTSLALSFDGHQKIFLFRTENSATFQTWEYKDSLHKGIRTGYRVPVKLKTEKWSLSPQEKDSIFTWTEALIQHPATPTTFCSDYIGKMVLEIGYGQQVNQYCSYSSICNWYTLNDKTSKLYALFQAKSKNIH